MLRSGDRAGVPIVRESLRNHATDQGQERRSPSLALPRDGRARGWFSAVTGGDRASDKSTSPGSTSSFGVFSPTGR